MQSPGNIDEDESMQTYDFSKPGSSAKIEKLLDSQMKKIYEAKMIESKNIEVPEFKIDDA